MGVHTSGQRARVRSMVAMVAALPLLVGVAFAGFEQTANRKIVAFRDRIPSQLQRQVVERNGSKVLHHLRRLNAATIVLPEDKGIALAALQADPSVGRVYTDHAIGADHVVSTTPVQAPSAEVFPWGVERIGVPSVFKLLSSWSSPGPVVAILDTGIDTNHPELVEKIVYGHNARAEENANDYQDRNGHGTHMAGIIGAAWNGKGIIGTAAFPQLVAVKVLDDSGHGNLSDLLNGLEWVLEHNNSVANEQRIRVVNMSLSFSEGSPLLKEITKQLYTAGVIMVASAGNRCADALEEGGAEEEGGDSGCDSSSTNVRYPAAYPQVIAVVATDNADKLTDYNRSGPQVALAAPGGSMQSQLILSTTRDGGYGLASGSSQAAAHVTGGAAVALQLAPWLSVREMVYLLKDTAKDLGYLEEYQGAGLLAVDAMVKRLLGPQ
ncbi:MAG TPA: S8 family serine peptidase [Candidatus Tectomicrobia bacterium]|nr:S8 family serine peptidase [Candidatus Tectomicrobia bacterium]